MVVELKKYKLIENLMSISDEKMLDDLEKMFAAYMNSRKSIKHLIKPRKKKTVVEELIKEQNYQGADKKVIDDLIENMAIEEPIEELLEML